MKEDRQKQVHEPDNLVTERDIDPDFGLFTEDSFPKHLRMRINVMRSSMLFPKRRLLVSPLRMTNLYRSVVDLKR